MRWAEEVLLLQEEMRRVLQFLQWHATWWDSQGSRLLLQPPEVAEGLLAYSKYQASIRRSLSNQFTHMWRFVDEYVRLGSDDVEAEQGEVSEQAHNQDELE
jgi:hypothetical protein